MTDTPEIVKSATLKDVETLQEKDTDGMDLLDDDGVKQKIATTIKGISIKDIKVDALRTFCAKVGIKGRGKPKKDLARKIAYSAQLDSAQAD
jgi:hypothetical protein